MYLSIKSPLSITLGVLLVATGSDLRADIKRTFVNNSGRPWTITIVPPAAGERKDPESGNMIFYKAGTTTELARLGESNPKGSFTLAAGTKANPSRYEVEFTHTSGRYFHYFSLKDARGDGGDVTADFGAAAMVSFADKVKLVPIGKFGKAVTFNSDSADKELAEKLTINENTVKGAKFKSMTMDIVNSSHKSKKDLIISLVEAKDGSVDCVSKDKPWTLGYVYKKPLTVSTDEDGKLDLTINLTGAAGSCSFQFTVKDGFITRTPVAVKIDGAKGKVVTTSGIIEMSEY